MKIKDQIILGIEDLKSMRFPFSIKIVIFSIIPALVLILLAYLANNNQYITRYDWVPIILFIQTFIILFQLMIIRTQAKYQKIPFTPEFDIESRYIQKNPMHESPGYYSSLVNNGDIAHRVNCKATIGRNEKGSEKLFFEKIPKNGFEKLLGYMEKEKFIKQPIRIYFSYYDKVGNHFYSRWFKLKDKEEFIAILGGQ